MDEVRDRCVVITGASSGIGKAISACFAREGAHLCLGAKPGETEVLTAWARELERTHAVRTWTFPVDLALPDGPERFHAAVRGIGRPIDCFVNNAGVLWYGSFAALTLEKQVEIVQVNVLAHMKLMRLFAEDMVKRRGGRIWNVSSVSAFQPCCHHAVYGATKAFVQSLSEAVHEELRGTGVTVCTLNPAYTDTRMIHGDGFPRRLWWFDVSGVRTPEETARIGYRAFKRGKALCIVGWQNRLIHTLLLRLTPRKLMAAMSYWVLQAKPSLHD
ncbi:MAG: SDR family oxidoreductase [Syntrophales bacterium]|nr:SDR family oxidoreductase [Syntrophales bacterium]MDD4340423.1 SDR family oxidoreductase [Syntrophales bacterium]HOS77987.1 SDR family oxidoreductase [Syntrophales bacterium]HPB70415.1 SDR family oxidoreductase [Syntrophales bacterium]HQN25258.1 SDR family oxidoreductase [Syntrophales bacterium]